MPIVMSDVVSARDLLFNGVEGTEYLLAVRADGTMVRVPMTAVIAAVDDRVDAGITAHEEAFTHTPAE
jgi:predicted solute-binding protein